MIKVLILEDNPLEAGLIRRELQKSGHNFGCSCVDSKEAYSKALHQFKPDAILSDYILPTYNGKEALELRNEVCPETPFIVVTGTVGEETAANLIKAGATDFFLKDSLSRIPHSILKAVKAVQAELEKAQLNEKHQDFLSTVPGIAFKYTLNGTAEGTYEVLRNNLNEWYDDEMFKLKGKEAVLKEYVHHEDWDGLECAIKRSRENGNILQHEFRLIMPNGNIRWMLYSAKPRNEGDKTSWVGVLIDRTKKKTLELTLDKERKEQRKMLEDLVAQRTEELLELNKDLEAFNYSVSHDLKNPIHNLNIFTNLLENKYRDQLDEDGKKFIDMIKKSSEDMETIIEDLLTFSQISRARIQAEEVRVEQLIQEVYQSLIFFDGEARTTLKISNCLPLCIDRGMVRHLFTNLISNALKYSRSRAKSILEISSIEKEGYVEYMVKDNGIGFDMNGIDDLFKPFTRLENATGFEGTGTGLAIVERIVRKHHGMVWAQSEPGKGATFYFRIPRNKTSQSNGKAVNRSRVLKKQSVIKNN